MKCPEEQKGKSEKEKQPPSTRQQTDKKGIKTFYEKNDGSFDWKKRNYVREMRIRMSSKFFQEHGKKK